MQIKRLPMVEYIFVSTEDEYKEAISLFKEYAKWLNIDLSFQKFQEEIETIKNMYSLPFGSIILCKIDRNYIACIAIRPKGDDIAEFKRMYVKPNYQRNKIGETLLEMSLQFAKNAGYKKVRLDTLNSMTPAMNLYEKNGFYKIDAYYFNPEPTAVYFEKTL